VNGRADLVRALAAAVEPPTPSLTAVAVALGLPRVPSAAEHTELFTFQLHPYASVHLGPEGQLGGIARDRIAGFLRALDVVPPPEPDHLVVLLGAYAELLDLDAGDGCRARHARTVLLHEHLGSWVPRFLLRVHELATEPYRVWAGLLDQLLRDEAELLGPPVTLPAHLREAPPLLDPREHEASTFLQGLLAPVRSGLVIARADLVRAARELDLGLRIGERAYLLRALLGQDASGTLAFLAAEAGRQHDHVRGDDPIDAFWRARLARSATLLDELATTGDGVAVPG
jgi:TorA maturation chaperone TorD